MLFDSDDYKTLDKILTLRRDVRGNLFKKKRVSNKDLKKILKAAISAPSVGYSQPWRFKIIEEESIKEKVYNEFKKSYEKSKKKFKDRPLYSKLKLEGIKESPINIALFYKKSDTEVLGQTYMKRSGEYSVVCAAQNMWLCARSLNIGIGWVSIIKPKKVSKILEVDDSHKLIAYLCIGYTKKFYNKPELEILHWENKKGIKECLIK